MLTGDEYMQLLQARMDAWLAGQPASRLAPPLLEWFIQDGDEALVDPAAPAPAPKRERRPRVHRSAASLRAERDRVQAQLDAITGDDCGDTAIVNLSPRSRSRAARTAGRRRFARLDRDLEQYTKLTARVANLNGRIASAEAREAVS